MAQYPGRTSQLPETIFFGGINRQSTILNIRDGEASDIQNFDLTRGDLRLRRGYGLVNSNVLFGSSNPDLYDIYTRQDGQQVHIIIPNGGGFFESTNPASGFSDRTGLVTVKSRQGPNGIPALGVGFGNAYIISSGGQSPLAYSQLNYNLVTLEAASRLDPPVGVSVTAQGTTGATIYYYVVTALTGRGETVASTTVVVTNGNAALSSTNFNRITWTPVLGANGGYRIYKFDSVSGTYKALTVGTASFTTATTFDDTGVAFYSPTLNPPSSNTAYNTPADWNANGYPEGVAAIAVGKDQRLLAWRGYTVWVSAANNCLDWLTTGADGAFTFPVYGGINNSIKAVGTLYDLTCIFTPTNAFFYSGTSANDFTLSRIQGTGCVSPKSIHQVENDLFLWSQYGPTSLQRILQGADVAATNISEKIRPLVNDDTRRDYWWQISAFNDPQTRRSIWLYPSSTSAGAANNMFNDSALVFNYNANGWTKYTNFYFSDGNLASDGTVYYAGNPSPFAGVTSVMSEGGYTDYYVSGNRDIVGTWVSAWYDLRTWVRKRMPWLDVIADSTVPAYSFTVGLTWDYGRNNTTSSHTLTKTTTDGRTLLQTYSLGNMHRIYTLGQGQAFRFIIGCTSNTQSPGLYGFRPEARERGVR